MIKYQIGTIDQHYWLGLIWKMILCLPWYCTTFVKTKFKCLPLIWSWSFGIGNTISASMNTCIFKFTENQIIICNCLLCLRWLNIATTPPVHLYTFCILVMFKLALKFLKWLKLLSSFKIEGLDSLIRVLPKWTTSLDNIHGEHFSEPLAIFLHKQI
jgi:hypothetical protein